MGEVENGSISRVPCGTSSRAREIPISGGGPRPLRSEERPQGLPWLTPRERQRVDSANQIYAFAVSLILLCEQLSKAWTLEQPYRSLFWWTTFWNTVEQHCSPIYIELHHCMFGSQRAKHTCIATNMAELQAISKTCDGQHLHLAWGRHLLVLQPLQRSHTQNVCAKNGHNASCSTWPPHSLCRCPSVCNRQTKQPGPAQAARLNGHLLLCLITMRS